MTISQVTSECFIATASKAFQESPDRFAAATLLEMCDEQPALTEGIIRLMNDLSEVAMPDDEEAQAGVFTMSAAVVALMYKSLKAQVEADELNQMFGEATEDDA